MESKRFSAWGDLVVVALSFLAAFLISVVYYAVIMFVAPDLGKEAIELITYLLIFSFSILFAVIFLQRRGSRGLLRFGMKWTDATLILGGLVLMTATDFVVEPLLKLFPAHYLEDLNKTMDSGSVWTMLMAVVAAPVLEEMLFRGVILEGLSRKWSVPAAVLASALLFGVLHFNPPQSTNAFIGAIVWGYLYLLRRSLVPLIVLHAINNGLALLFLKIFGTQAVDTRELIGNDAVYWAIYAVCVVIFVTSLVFMHRRIRTKTGEITLQKEP